MNASDPVDVAEIAQSKAASHDVAFNEKKPAVDELTIDSAPQIAYGTDDDIDKTSPTNEELANLRRVSGKIPWTAYTVAFVELCERFSYYGTTAVCKKQFSQLLLSLKANLHSRELHSTSTSARIYHRGTCCRYLGLE